MALPRKVHRLCCLVSLAFILGPVGSVAAQRSMPRLLQQAEVDALLASWQESYQAIVTDLKAQDPRLTKRARKRATALYEDVVDRAVSGEILCQTAGRVLTLLAVAEVRLGDRAAGAWHWQMAQNISADLRDEGFAAYPDVAPFMKKSLIPEKRWEALRHYLRGEDVPPKGEDCENVVPPSIKKKVPPKYPAGLAGQRIKGSTVVESFIGKDGRLHEPVVQRGCGHVSLDLAAMEALRGWEYEPATRDGKPVVFLLSVTVNFVLGQ